MAKTKVLLVDDSPVIRRLLSQLIDAERDMSVVGSAPNGSVGLAKIERLDPDVVVLDIEMPEMDGLAMISEARRTHRDLPLIVFSSHTERGAKVTIDSLLTGATDYVTKPAQTGSREEAVQCVRASLLPRIRALGAGRRAGRSAPARTGRAARRNAERTGSPVPLPAPEAAGHPQVIAIGVSTGGPNALMGLLPRLPLEALVPILIVQHMPPMFTRALADRLDQISPYQVRECSAPQRVLPGQAWIAAGGTHMVVERGEEGIFVRPETAEPVNSCRPSVDVLFDSVAASFGGAALSVVMTGMGEDGLAGCRRLRAAGAQVVVQDEASSVVWGMPGAVANAGLAHAVAPLDRLDQEILSRLEYDAALDEPSDGKG